MHFAARAGKSYEEAAAAGRNALGEEQVMEGVPDIVSLNRVEVLLDEGSRLIVRHDPLRGAGTRA